MVSPAGQSPPASSGHRARHRGATRLQEASRVRDSAADGGQTAEENRRVMLHTYGVSPDVNHTSKRAAGCCSPSQARPRSSSPRLEVTGRLAMQMFGHWPPDIDQTVKRSQGSFSPLRAQVVEPEGMSDQELRRVCCAFGCLPDIDHTAKRGAPRLNKSVSEWEHSKGLTSARRRWSSSPRPLDVRAQLRRVMVQYVGHDLAIDNIARRTIGEFSPNRPIRSPAAEKLAADNACKRSSSASPSAFRRGNKSLSLWTAEASQNTQKPRSVSPSTPDRARCEPPRVQRAGRPYPAAKRHTGIVPQLVDQEPSAQQSRLAPLSRNGKADTHQSATPSSKLLHEDNRSTAPSTPASRASTNGAEPRKFSPCSCLHAGRLPKAIPMPASSRFKLVSAS